MIWNGGRLINVTLFNGLFDFASVHRSHWCSLNLPPRCRLVFPMHCTLHLERCIIYRRFGDEQVMRCGIGRCSFPSLSFLPPPPPQPPLGRPDGQVSFAPISVYTEKSFRCVGGWSAVFGFD